MSKLKIGIAGAIRGYLFYELFSKLNDAEAVAIMDPSEEALNKFCATYPLRPFTKFEELLDSGIDAVLLASPMHVHARQAAAALQRGIHVLSEVTAAVTMEECRELLQAAKHSKAKYMMGENYCYFRENIAIRNMIQAGVFGKIYFAEGEFIDSPFSNDVLFDRNGNPTWRKTYFYDKRGCTYGTHSLGPVVQWFNERLVSVSCFGSGNHSAPELKHDNTTLMLCQTESGALIKIRTDLISNRPKNRYFSLQGTEGCYEGQRTGGDDHRVWLKSISNDQGNWRPLSDFYRDFLPTEMIGLPEEAKGLFHFGADYFMVKDFVRCILEDRPVPIDHYSALNFTIPGLLSEQSIAAGGAPVSIPDIRNW